MTLEYQPETLRVAFEGREIEVHELGSALEAKAWKRVLLEATTLGFAEILVCCHALHSGGWDSVGLLYVEPGKYKKKERSEKVRDQRDFELSERIIGYTPIPGSIASLDEVPADDADSRNVIFLLGFEGERIDRAIEDLPIDPRQCDVVFGVPGFRPGWEIHSFANNIRVMCDAGFAREPRFCPADNPRAVFDMLTEIRQALPEGSQMLVAPIGTKPHGIGAALFTCEFREVGVLYDHPKKRQKRSDEIGKWHFFTAEFGERE